MFVRQGLLDVIGRTLKLRDVLLKLAEKHVETVIGGYSMYQHSVVNTWAHYCLSYVCGLERDFERLSGAYKRLNISAFGAVGQTGSDFPTNPERTAELLGFDRFAWNARDAFHAKDHMLELYTSLATRVLILR